MRVGAIVEGLITIFASKAKRSSIEIKLETRQDPEILAIEGEIRQVVANLLNNSIDAIAGGGTIRIRVSAHHKWDRKSWDGVRVTIADSGHGIAPEDCTKLFEPFFTARKQVGTGLGLWISDGIVRRHNGSIRFKSCTISGKSGTTFSVSLPSDAAPRSD